MKPKLFLLATISAVTLSAGCANQEDMLHADLWSGDPEAYTAHTTEDVRDLGKTSREKMLDQRKLDEERKKSKSLKDEFLDGLADGVLEKLFDSK